ncbi:tautomerase family protein [Falsibacillus pallidus]|uniref:tautomerase family protein n=1 Tax=Falsibacillus pallidus TaxID=493781 RepID=UPI003D99E5D1
MPIVTVYYPEGLANVDQLESASKGIHQSLIEHFLIPEADYFQLYMPFPANQFFFDPHYLLDDGQERSQNTVYISITCGPGRTVEQKKELYWAVAERVSADLEIAMTDVFITLNEAPAENWSFGDGVGQMIDSAKDS